MEQDLEALRHHFENDGFPAASGMRLVELRPGFAKTCVRVEPRHMNNVGLVHGGAIFTLAAFAFGAAAKTSGQVAVGINTNMTFIQGARSGTLYAEATEVSRSRRLSTCTVRITDEAGELIALLQATAYLKDQPFPPADPATSEP